MGIAAQSPRYPRGRKLKGKILNFNRPSQVNIERAWMTLREGVEALERVGKRSDAARRELDDFEKKHQSVNFDLLQAQFIARRSSNTGELGRRWMELQSAVDSVTDPFQKAIASDVLRTF